MIPLTKEAGSDCVEIPGSLCHTPGLEDQLVIGARSIWRGLDDAEVLRSALGALTCKGAELKPSVALTLVRSTFRWAQEGEAFPASHMTTEIRKVHTAPEMLIDKGADYFSFLNVFWNIYPTSF